MKHPISGYMPIEKLRELAAAPFGAAVKEIRKYDPLYGFPITDEPIRWKVTFSRKQPQIGVAYVTAASKDEAESLADQIESDQIDWEEDDESSLPFEEIEGCIPEPGPPRTDPRQFTLF